MSSVRAFCIAACVATLGCRTMAPVSTPADYVATRHPESVWITDSDHSVLRVRGPRMVGDTVVGDVGNRYVKIPLSGISHVAVSRPALGKTVLLAAAGAAIVGGGLVLMLSHYGGHTGQNTCLTPNEFDEICGGPPT